MARRSCSELLSASNIVSCAMRLIAGGSKRSQRPAPRATFGQFRPRFEQLEDRVLMAVDLDWSIGLNRGNATGTTNAAGEVYITGNFNRILDLDPANVHEDNSDVVTAPAASAFAAKYSPAGEFLWGTAFSGQSYEIAIGSDGNAHITGSFLETATFGQFSLTSAGADDGFAIELDGTTGRTLWATRFGGANIDNLYDVAVDATGNVVLTGTSRKNPYPRQDIQIIKLDTNGGLLWSKEVGSGGMNVGDSVALDASGNVHVAGSFTGTVDFDPGAGSYNLSSGGRRNAGRAGVVLKLNPVGDFIWARHFQAGTYGHSEARDVAVDPAGNVYTSGIFMETVDFDPGTGKFNRSSVQGSMDGFVSKLDATGKFLWAKSLGNSNNDSLGGLALDSTGNVYLTGGFSGTTDLNPNSGVFQRTSAGGYDAFVVKLDTNGNFVWAVTIGGTGDDGGGAVSIDTSGNIYVFGGLSGPAYFNSDPLQPQIGSETQIGPFIAKLKQS